MFDLFLFFYLFSDYNFYFVSNLTI